MKNPLSSKYLASSILVAIFVFLGGMFIGARHPALAGVAEVTNAQMPQNITADFAPFWKVWHLLDEKYAGSVSDQNKVYGAIQGLVGATGDPYTTFFPPEENKNFESEIQGEFGGVGMEVGMKDGILTIIAPLKGTPAEKSGLKSGDKILKINDTLTNDLTIDEAVKMMRGPAKTTLRLTVYSQAEDATKEFSIERDIISIPTLDTEARKDGIFVISLYSFNANSADLFGEAIRKFVKSGDKKMILDLRGNPGGYLDQAVDMASYFLDRGKVVVQEDPGNDGKKTTYESKGYSLLHTKPELIILVDGGTASAAEILAGALSENGLAKMVGEQTFGKGSVQEFLPVTKDTSVKITVAHWLTPNGISISKQGLKPDVEVKFTAKDASTKSDPAFDKAVSLLK